jgi:hypothetical protein
VRGARSYAASRSCAGAGGWWAVERGGAVRFASFGGSAAGGGQGASAGALGAPRVGDGARADRVVDAGRGAGGAGIGR